MAGSNNRIQKTMESILGGWVFLLSAGFALLSTFRYVIDYRKYAPYFQWVTVGFGIAVVLYILVSVFASRESRIRMGKILKKYFSPEQILLMGLLFWFALSCFLNEYYGVFRPYLGFYKYLYLEDWLLFVTAVSFLVLFPLARLAGMNKARKMFELIIHLVVISYSVFTIICLWYTFHLEDLNLPSGEVAGMTVDVQLMLGYHNNTTGMIALTMLCLCIYMVLTQEGLIRAVYIVFSLVQLSVVYLSNSRAVFLAVLIFAVFIIFFISWRYLEKERTRKRLGICLFLAALSGVAVWFGRQGMFVLFEQITHFSEYLNEEVGELAVPLKNVSPSMLSARVQQGIYPALLDVEGTKGIDGLRRLNDVSGRFVIWSDCIRLMSYKPFTFLFGVTDVEFPSAILMLPGHQYWKQPSHAHNAVLQIGATMGVPAMLMFIAFLIIIGVKCIRIIKKAKDKKLPYIVSGILLCFIVVNMAEAYLVGYFSVIACFFFLFCGCVVTIDAEKNDQGT